MKKERNLLILLTILILTYSALLIFSPEFRANLLSFGFLFLSAFLMIKSYFFRSDSSLFLAVLLFQSSVIFSKEITYISTFFQISSYFSLAVSISFFVDWLFFNKKILFWTFLLNFFISFPIFLFATHCINLILMILFLCLAMIISILLFIGRKYGKI